MKNKFFGVCILCFAANLMGCAMEKAEVVQPVASPVYSTQQSTPGVVRDPGVVKSVQQPRYLEIEESDDEIMEQDIEATLPPTIYVNDRIFEYGRKLDRWKELDSESVNLDLNQDEAEQMVRCFRRLQNVMTGYANLRGKMLQAQKRSAVERITNAEIFELQKSDVAFLESACGQLLKEEEGESVGWNRREEKADLAQLETLIDRYSENKEYEEIIQVWVKIPDFQIDRINLRTKLLYGNALMFLHQEEKAADIYQQVVDQMSVSKEQATDLVSLRKILADLYTSSGNYQSARTQYKQISEDYLQLGFHEEWSNLQLSILDKSMSGSPELTEYSALLRDYLGFNPEKDGYKVAWQAEKFLTSYPYSTVSSNVDYIKAATQKGADSWFEDFIAGVDQLSSEKKFEEAMDLLETIPTDIIDAIRQIAVNEKNQELVLAEAVEKETERMAEIQDLQRQWNNGMLLTKSGRYDEAINVFTDLLETEYSVKAEKKIDEVSLQAAKADRRKAADLFIRFTKTTDIESKKKLLIESRKLLKDILVKYPEIEIGPKVNGNIQRVEQEMIAIDPNLIFVADQEAEVLGDDGLDAAFSLPNMTGNNVEQPIIEGSVETGPE